jgi:hypothetical protein
MKFCTSFFANTVISRWPSKGLWKLSFDQLESKLLPTFYKLLLTRKLEKQVLPMSLFTARHETSVLEWIWILGSGPLTNGSGSGSCSFYQFSSKAGPKFFLAYYLLKVHLHHFSQIKSLKVVTKLDNGRSRCQIRTSN